MQAERAEGRIDGRNGRRGRAVQHFMSVTIIQDFFSPEEGAHVVEVQDSFGRKLQIHAHPLIDPDPQAVIDSAIAEFEGQESTLQAYCSANPNTPVRQMP